MRLVRGPPAPPGSALRWAAALGVTLLALARFLPFDRVPAMCPARLFFHLPCPSCGGTRAFIAFTHGEGRRALQWNPLATLVAVFAVVFAVWLLLRWTIVRRPLAVQISRVDSIVVRALVPLIVAANWAYLLLNRATIAP